MSSSIIRRLTSSRKIFAGIAGALLISAHGINVRAGNTIDRLLTLGDQELKAGHYATARQYYLSALARDNYDVKILLKVAQVEEKIGDVDSAIKRARLATQVEPADPNSHLELARYLEANRDAKAAELQYERAVELTKDPKQAVCSETKAIQLLIDLDDIEKADRLSHLWLKENKKDAARHFNRALVLSCSEKLSRQQEALKEFNQTLTLAPDFNKAHYDVALLYLKLGEKDPAKQELEIFIKNNPPADQLSAAKEKLGHLLKGPTNY